MKFLQVYHVTGTFWNDFWMGRELNPFWCGVDIKFVLFRSAIFLWLIVDWSLLAAQFQVKGVVTPSLAIVVIMHTVCMANTIKNEVSQCRQRVDGKYSTVCALLSGCPKLQKWVVPSATLLINKGSIGGGGGGGGGGSHSSWLALLWITTSSPSW